MSFFNSTSVPTFNLIIGLKSSSVDVQLVRHPVNGVREVLFAQRNIILLGDSLNPTEYTEKCMSALIKLLKTGAPEITKHIQKSKIQTEVILYAPWFTSRITEHNHSREVVLTKNFLEQKLESIKTPTNLVNLENKVIKIITNGYSITELIKAKLQNVTLQIYSSYISEKIYKKIQSSLQESLPLIKNIRYTTSPLLIFEQIKTLLVKEDNICFIYVGGEITEIGIIEDDLLSYYGTFPIGKHDFLRELQSTTSSYDYDLLYQKEIQIKTKKKQDSFEELRKQWKQSLDETLGQSNAPSPSKVLLISDAKTRDFFSKLVSQHFDNGQGDMTSHYRIINFDISYLKDIISYKTPTNTNELDLQLEALI